MLTYKVNDFKCFSQKFYNKCINSINLASVKCSCGARGTLIKHGYYKRCIKTPIGSVSIRILRVKCSSCNTTHAILLSSFVPYSQVSLEDHVNIITKSPINVMAYNPFIDESNIYSIKKKYNRFFFELLRSFSIKLDPLSSLINNCFRLLKRQFMQLRNSYKLPSGQIILVDNILFS